MGLGIPRSNGPGSPWTWPPGDCADQDWDWTLAIEAIETDPDSF